MKKICNMINKYLVQSEMVPGHEMHTFIQGYIRTEAPLEGLNPPNIERGLVYDDMTEGSPRPLPPPLFLVLAISLSPSLSPSLFLCLARAISRALPPSLSPSLFLCLSRALSRAL